MRAALLCYSLLAVAAMQIGSAPTVGDKQREIPLFVRIGDAWVCVDRNPAQIGRKDCWPRLPRASKGSQK